ncbi:unnamed protein product [Spodoptera littoralis]|uniref:Uncharacterized protein n=1 Tax=Spodoptera littoralis TaxID=7109 RepID=A0A9P0I9J7_SPOLI|nr:unnamed protein product [Spodoptera littoralis]CAB3512160.1 unnamed protein product [Spodoptera littoralis]CAB3512161.1 unnamed protein product [Spodoptera littoralis]CAH1641849.1 unnamed protein product [Spodoptera littoralis]CAH1641850.1 unnamed protein product [Spodoptera littoralis]
MPLDVLGRTRATLKESACSPWPRGPGNPLKLLRAGDWGLQLSPINEEFLADSTSEERIDAVVVPPASFGAFGCDVVSLTDIASASFFYRWPQIREDHPPNLSILVSGGKETNQDFLSSGERTGKKPSTESRRCSGGGRCGVREVPLSRRDLSCPRVNLRNSNERTERFIVIPRRTDARLDAFGRFTAVGTGRVRRRPRTSCTSLLVNTSRPVRCRSKRRTGAPLPLRGGSGTATVADRPSDGSSDESRTRSIRVRPDASQRRIIRLRHSADVCAARLVSQPCCLGLCASLSAMIQFRALAGPVLKHGPRSLACMRVIETIKLKGATKVKARARRALREDGASI